VLYQFLNLLHIVLQAKDKRRTEYVAIIYQLDNVSVDHQLVVTMGGPVTQFKISDKYIGIQNLGPGMPFIIKDEHGIVVEFWIECNSFSYDCTRNYIYFNVNKSIFQFDPSKSAVSQDGMSRQVAENAISNLSNLTYINDRFLLVRSIHLNGYSIFDMIDHVIVWSIQLSPEFKVSHVGKLNIVFSDSKEYIIVPFI